VIVKLPSASVVADPTSIAEPVPPTCSVTVTGSPAMVVLGVTAVAHSVPDKMMVWSV
jgi:hypothetical protein